MAADNRGYAAHDMLGVWRLSSFQANRRGRTSRELRKQPALCRGFIIVMAAC